MPLVLMLGEKAAVRGAEAKQVTSIKACNRIISIIYDRYNSDLPPSWIYNMYYCTSMHLSKVPAYVAFGSWSRFCFDDVRWKVSERTEVPRAQHFWQASTACSFWQIEYCTTSFQRHKHRLLLSPQYDQEVDNRHYNVVSKRRDSIDQSGEYIM